MLLFLTAWIDGTAWVGWISLVHGNKPWLCTGQWRWRWTHFGLARHRLCWLFTNTYLALVFKPLINLIEKTRAVTWESENKVKCEATCPCICCLLHEDCHQDQDILIENERFFRIIWLTQYIQCRHSICGTVYSPHSLTHIPDSLLNSMVPSGQKHPSVVKLLVGKDGL